MAVFWDVEPTIWHLGLSNVYPHFMAIFMGKMNPSSPIMMSDAKTAIDFIRTIMDGTSKNQILSRGNGDVSSGSLLHSYWKWCIYKLFTYSPWWFSIAMLHYQRVSSSTIAKRRMFTSKRMWGAGIQSNSENRNKVGHLANRKGEDTQETSLRKQKT